jgi:tRNA1Val (adenine37-N6)-methyltransferase
MALFQFKYFAIDQTDCAMKIGTDSLILGAWTQVKIAPKRILDIGTGTGVLSLMMAQKYPSAEIVAVDIDPLAANRANENFRANSIGVNCYAERHDIRDYVSNEQFDLIISNPPYFENALKSSSEQKAIARHTDTLPLNLLFERVSELLSEDGAFSIILPAETMKRFIESPIAGLFPYRIFLIYGKADHLNRMAVLFTKKSCTPITSSIVVRDSSGNYSPAYKQLTIDFHGVKL